jgi:CheY-like chemotaxis protein
MVRADIDHALPIRYPKLEDTVDERRCKAVCDGAQSPFTATTAHRKKLAKPKGNEMPEHVTLALIVAKPGPLRNSLQALMTTVPKIEIVAETDNPSALLRMGETMQPDIVLLDASLSKDDVWAALRRIQKEWSRTRSIVLVEGSQQQQRAQAAGADVVLIQGYPAAGLITAIEELLHSSSLP